MTLNTCRINLFVLLHAFIRVIPFTGMATKTARMADLARAKPLPAGFIEDKRSVYTESKIVKRDPNAPTKFLLTDRQGALCQPKPYHNNFTQDRPSPIWAVSAGAKSASASAGIQNLAKPKNLHPEWTSRGSVQTVVTSGALKAVASERLTQLSQPKKCASLPVKEGTGWDYSEWSSEISPSALKAVASSRVETLAEAKNTHSAYLPPCPVQSVVHPKTLTAKASSHICQLARPKDRKELEENPNVWKVSSGAKAAQASQRVCDLAQPIPRKVRTKKATTAAA